MYYIYSKEESEREGEPMFWSNQFGWTTFESATDFKEEEAKLYRLPIGGAWVSFREAMYLFK